LKKAIHTVLHFGVQGTESQHDIRRIKTTNLINGIMVLFLCIGYTNYFIVPESFPVIQVSTFLCLALLSLYLNKIKKTQISFLLFTINVNLSIFFINEYYPIEVGAYLFYFPLIVSVVLLNNPSLRDKNSLIHFSVCALFFLTSLLIEFPDFQLKTLDAAQMKSLWYYDLVMAVSITGILSFILTRIIYNQNREILAQNQDLKKAKEIVNTSLKEKEILLAELHHRVKNNLAIISGLLNLQEDATTNFEAKQIIGDSKTRIMSMALVHKMLYENNELKRIHLGKYASELIYELFYSYNLLKTVSLDEDYDEVVLPVNKSIPLGLILNEVVTNSIKYAFKGSSENPCVFTIRIKLVDNLICIVIQDNGPGFAQNFNPESDTLSLGIYLIKTLTEQLDGTVRFLNDGGAKIELDFVHN
jgi:two-component sensor histidine kinase